MDKYYTPRKKQANVELFKFCAKYLPECQNIASLAGPEIHRHMQELTSEFPGSSLHFFEFDFSIFKMYSADQNMNLGNVHFGDLFISLAKLVFDNVKFDLVNFDAQGLGKAIDLNYCYGGIFPEGKFRLLKDHLAEKSIIYFNFNSRNAKWGNLVGKEAILKFGREVANYLDYNMFLFPEYIGKGGRGPHMVPFTVYSKNIKTVSGEIK